jgi:hypothetical protein
MHCSRCGTPASPPARFCGRCGGQLYAIPTPPAPRQSSTKRNLIALVTGLGATGFILCLLSLNDSSNKPVRSDHDIQQQKARVEAAARLAPKLLASARAETHPGLIYRYACQIPANSPQYKEAKAQLRRADRILDQVIGKADRKQFCTQLQANYYGQGKKIKCNVIEGSKPVLRLTYILFGETTAYQADKFFDAETQQLFLAKGFHSVSFSNGFGESSFVRWKAHDVEEAQYGRTRALCEAVRSGEASADNINATVSNPTPE